MEEAVACRLGLPSSDGDTVLAGRRPFLVAVHQRIAGAGLPKLRCLIHGGQRGGSCGADFESDDC